MELDMLIILGLCVVIILILVVMFIKDKQTDKKFERFDQVITDSMQQNYMLAKKVEELHEMVTSGGGSGAPNLDINAIADVIDEAIEMRLSGMPSLVDSRVEAQMRPVMDKLKDLINSVKK